MVKLHFILLLWRRGRRIEEEGRRKKDKNLRMKKDIAKDKRLN